MVGDVAPVGTATHDLRRVRQPVAHDEAVAEAAAKLNRWEFMLTFGPVPVTGGTGFPLNALAIF